MKTLKIILNTDGSVKQVIKNFTIYRNSFNVIKGEYYIPESLFTSGNEFTLTSAMLLTTDKGLCERTNAYSTLLATETETIDGITYKVFSQDLPTIYRKYAGTQKLVLNLVELNTSTEPITIQTILTSQLINVDVNESDYIYQTEEPLTPSEEMVLTARINQLQNDKQDKEDNNIDTNQSQSILINKNVVYSLNTLSRNAKLTNENVSRNQSEIEDNTRDIYNLDTRVTNLEYSYGHSETYIGTIYGTASVLTDETLNAYVREHTQPTRDTKNGDVILYVQEIEQGTDKNFKYIYSNASGWQHYEIPPVEKASNSNYGTIKGTTGNIEPNSNSVKVDIVNGEIQNINFNDKETADRVNLIADYKQTKSTLNAVSGVADNNATDIYNIKTGNIIVDKTNKDRLDRVIDTTYLDYNTGATKQELYNYALPKEFNEVYYLNVDNEFTTTIPTTTLPLATITTNGIGDYALYNASYEIQSGKFQLTNKNSYTSELYIESDNNIEVYLRCTTEYYDHLTEQWITLNTEITTPLFIRSNVVTKVDFKSMLDNVTGIINVSPSDKIKQSYEININTISAVELKVWSTPTYHSNFGLNISNAVIDVQPGYTGEIKVYHLTGTLQSGTIIYDLGGATLYNDVVAKFELEIPNQTLTTEEIYLSINSQLVKLYTPSMNGVNNTAVYDQMQATIYNYTNCFEFLGLIKINQQTNDIYVQVLIDNENATVNKAVDIASQMIENSKQIYQASYGTTTYAQITQALTTDKLIIMNYNGVNYIYGSYNSSYNEYYFYNISPNTKEIQYIKLNSSNQYFTDTLDYERVANKITLITSQSTDLEYPSAKAVYDLVTTEIQTAITTTLNTPV